MSDLQSIRGRGWTAVGEWRWLEDGKLRAAGLARGRGGILAKCRCEREREGLDQFERLVGSRSPEKSIHQANNPAGGRIVSKKIKKEAGLESGLIMRTKRQGFFA